MLSRHSLLRCIESSMYCYKPAVYMATDEFGAVPKFAWFCPLTRKTNSEPYQSLHGSACLHERRIRNRTKIYMVLPVNRKDEFGTVPKFAWFCLFTRKTNSEPYQNLHGFPLLHLFTRVYTKDEFRTVPKFAWFQLVPPVYTKDEYTVYLKIAWLLSLLYAKWIKSRVNIYEK